MFEKKGNKQKSSLGCPIFERIQSIALPLPQKWDNGVLLFVIVLDNSIQSILLQSHTANYIIFLINFISFFLSFQYYNEKWIYDSQLGQVSKRRPAAV